VRCDNVGVLGWPAVEDVDWGVLFHAYGPADETPAHLRALTGDDHKAQLDAMDHLFYEVLHQGTVYPATAVAVRVVSGLLGDVPLRRQGADGQSLLADALDFLDGAAEQAVLCPVENAEGAPTVPEVTGRQVQGYFAALEEGEDIEPFLPAINALWRAGMADLQAAAGEVYRAAEPFLRDTDIAVRIRSVGLLTRLVQLPTAAGNRDSLRSGLLSRAHEITDRNELASAVLGLAELGADPDLWLADADPAIRACAALPLHDNLEATRVLLAALLEPESVDRWFSDPPRWFPYGVRETLLSELLSRDVSFEDVLPIGAGDRPHSTGAQRRA
jgi:hypothetical protein